MTSPFSLEVFNTSVYRLDSSFNVINAAGFTNMADSLKSLATQLPEGKQTVSGTIQEKAAKEFIGYDNELWIIIEGKWWRLNPNRLDFRSKSGSKLFAHWGDSHELRNAISLA